MHTNLENSELHKDIRGLYKFLEAQLYSYVSRPEILALMFEMKIGSEDCDHLLKISFANAR